MRKTVAFLIIIMGLMGFAEKSRAEVSLQSQGEGRWAILDSGGEVIGALEKAEGEGLYNIVPKGGMYLGTLNPGGELQLAGRHRTITPADARLYLDVLEAVKTLK